MTYPTTTGYYLVENTVPEDERLDCGKGRLTIRRVLMLRVFDEDGGYWRGEWKRAGVYVDDGEHLREVQRYCDRWEGLRFIPLDLDAIAARWDQDRVVDAVVGGPSPSVFR